MKTLLLFTLSFLITPIAFADITMVQHTFMGVAKTPMITTMYVKGGKIRTDNDTTSTLIMDSNTGDMTTLVHEQKMVLKQNTKELEALAQQAPKSDQPMPTTKITATGKKETIDGYDCEIYTSENMGMVVKMWVTKSYPGQEKLREELKVMAKLSAPGAPKQPEVPGIAVKTEFEQQGLKFITKLVSLSADPVDDSKFAIPTGYKAP